MTTTATVTDILTKGFAEVMIPPEDGGKSRRCIAANDLDAKRGDLVELKPATPWNDPIARTSYLMVPALFLLGLYLDQGKLSERVLSGLILAALGFILSWLMNRRARLRRRLEYRIVHITKRVEQP